MDLWRVFKDERYFNIRTHADEQESGRKGKTEGTYHYRKGKIHA